MASTDDKGPTLTAVNIAFLCITIFSVLLRVFTRLRVVKSFGIDDTLILFAAAASIAQVVSPQIGICSSLPDQLGSNHLAKLSSMVSVGISMSSCRNGESHTRSQWSLPQWLTTLPPCSSNYLSWPSTFDLGKRILPGRESSLTTTHSPYSTFRFLTYILIFISAAFGVGSVVAVGVQCIPLSMLWDPTAPGGKCFNVTLFYFANAGIHIVTEILIYILPIQTLWKLHLPMRQKLGLCGLMGLGAM
jgi:hypothetical protein